MFWTVTEIIWTAFFAVDIVFKFFLAYKEAPESQEVVKDLKLIRMRYLRWDRTRLVFIRYDS